MSEGSFRQREPGHEPEPKRAEQPPEHMPPAHAPARPTKTGDSERAGKASPAPAANGLTDQFMAINWDSSAFWKLVQVLGVPAHAPKEVVSEIDRWLPPALTPDQRTTIKIVATIGGAVLDKHASSLLHLLPVIGPMLTIADGAKETQERVAVYHALGDPVGEQIARARGLVDTFAELVDNANTPIEGIVADFHILDTLAKAAATAGLVAGPADAPLVGFAAAVGAMVAVLDAFSTTLNLAVYPIRTLQTWLAEAEIANAVVKSNTGPPGQGQFARSDAYSMIVEQSAVSVVGYAMEAVLQVAGDIGSVVELGTVGGVDVEGAVDIASIAAGIGLADGEAALAAVQQTLGGPALGLGSSLAAPIYGMSTGDELKSRAPFMPLPGHGTDPELATGQTATAMDSRAAQVAAHSPDPQWHPALVMALAAAPAFSFETAPDLAKPTYWIERIASVVRQGVAGASAQTVDGFGKTIDLVGAWMQPGLQLARDGMQAFIATHLPHLQRIALDVNHQLQQTHVDLAIAQRMIDRVTGMLAGGQRALEVVRVVGAKLTTDVLLSIENMKIKNVPAVPGIADAVGRINAGLTRLEGVVVAAYQTQIIPLEIALARMLGGARQQLTELHDDLAQGHDVQRKLDAQYRRILAMVDRGVKAFAAIAPVLPRLDITGAGDWLRKLAQRWRVALDIERGAAPDPWKKLLPALQALVAAWQATRGPDVQAAFLPLPSARERGAVASLVQRGEAALARLPADRRMVWKAQLTACVAQLAPPSGQPGRQPRLDGWAAENRLAMTVAAIEAVAAGGVTS